VVIQIQPWPTLTPRQIRIKIKLQKKIKKIIADIESVIQTELSGNNNGVNHNFMWMMVDKRYTSDEQYAAVIRYRADTYGVAGDYKSKNAPRKKVKL